MKMDEHHLNKYKFIKRIDAWKAVDFWINKTSVQVGEEWNHGIN